MNVSPPTETGLAPDVGRGAILGVWYTERWKYRRKGRGPYGQSSCRSPCPGHWPGLGLVKSFSIQFTPLALKTTEGGIQIRKKMSLGFMHLF